MTARTVGLIIFLVLFSEILNVAGQFLFKKIVNKIRTPNLKNLQSYGRFFREVLMSKWIWLGLAMMTAGLGVWLMALSEGDLSFVYSVGSLQYILVLIVGHFFLNEKVSRARVLGTVLVACGVLLVTLS